MATRYPDQNFKEECCGLSKHGCNIHEEIDIATRDRYCHFKTMVTHVKHIE